jgi:hypothetical protein
MILKPISGAAKMVLKKTITKALWTLGYDIHKRTPPPGILTDDILTDDILPVPWVSHVLQMSNRYYRPPVLQYPSRFGEDERLRYINYFLDVRGQRILEIGPLEAYYSIILEKMGVRENISIEARAINVQKCQRIKEKYHLDRTQFVQADLERLYSGKDVATFNGPFDLVFCLGVLYHLPDPGRGLEWMRSQSNTLFLGTHYCVDPRQDIMKYPQEDIEYFYNGSSYRARRVPEGGIDNPIMGMSPNSVMLYESDLLRLIHDVGYPRISVLGKEFINYYYIMLLAEV